MVYIYVVLCIFQIGTSYLLDEFMVCTAYIFMVLTVFINYKQYVKLSQALWLTEVLPLPY